MNNALRALAILCLALLSGCADPSHKESTLLGVNVPGLGDMYAPSKEEKADEAWWDSFYGHKSSSE